MIIGNQLGVRMSIKTIRKPNANGKRRNHGNHKQIVQHANGINGKSGKAISIQILEVNQAEHFLALKPAIYHQFGGNGGMPLMIVKGRSAHIYIFL